MKSRWVCRIGKVGWLGAVVLAFGMSGLRAAHNPLSLPEVGTNVLRVLSRTMLELSIVGTAAPDPQGTNVLTREAFQAMGVGPQDFVVRVGSTTNAVLAAGFKRRPMYAPLAVRDLRVESCVYLRLTNPISDGQTVEVENPTRRIWPASMRFISTVGPYRWSPAIHVNQVGYLPSWYKRAKVGYYLGSMGEMTIDGTAGFSIVDLKTAAVVYTGALKRRLEVGFAASCYQQVWEADFSAYATPGVYVLMVNGMGISYPFTIHEGVLGTFARTYALGLYHQRCGTSNAFPFTRHVHEACHTAGAEVPTMANAQVQSVLAAMSDDYAEDSRHTAPQLKDLNSCLYPFVRQGLVDVTGGHHDAGDYSKYTINSAGLIHHLVFAADAFPGAGALDNLGLPESGDGKSDLLQEAKWEADFLCKMQDTDGGFYFLVYPRDRQYESDVLPDEGDPQVVFPKTTAATAAAVAALAQTASSPLFKQQFPAEASLYLQRALLGWDFLELAINTYGWDGSYQKISHYGDTFRHDDELAWAAAELYAATGDPKFQSVLVSNFDPSDPNTLRWGWWRLFEGYGCAVRSYAFAVRTGRLTSGQLDAAYLSKCQAQVLAAGQDQQRWARESAYGTSLSYWDKGYGTPGWYFSNDRAFDLAVAFQLDPKAAYLEAMSSNNDYEAGCNPVNVTYLTGLGWRRQREIVHQYAQNDHRVLPPSGIPLGNVQGGFDWLYLYERQLGALNFPSDSDPTNPYPVYDRWGDTFNLRTEFVIVNQGRGLGGLAFLFGNSSLNTQPWRSADPVITLQTVSSKPTQVLATLSAPGLELAGASVVWESKDRDPLSGRQVLLNPLNVGPQWVEVEAQLPDGRRVFGKTNFFATSVATFTTNSLYKTNPVTVTSDMAALYRFNGGFSDATGKNSSVAASGNALLDDSNLAWMLAPAGQALRVQDVGDEVKVVLPRSSVYSGSTTKGIVLEAMIYVKSYETDGVADTPLFSLYGGWNASLEVRQNKWDSGPYLRGGIQTLLDCASIGTCLSLKQWHKLSIAINQSSYVVTVDGNEVARVASSDLANWGAVGSVTLQVGNFDGWVDELVVRRLN